MGIDAVVWLFCVNAGVDVGVVEVAEPHRAGAVGLHRVVELEHAAGVAAVAAPDHPVIDRAPGDRRLRLDGPADDGVVEGLCDVGVGGVQFIPDMAANGLGHAASPAGSVLQ